MTNKHPSDESPISEGYPTCSYVGMNLPQDHRIDYGIITSGACPTEKVQDYFDAHLAGKPPIG